MDQSRTVEGGAATASAEARNTEPRQPPKPPRPGRQPLPLSERTPVKTTPTKRKIRSYTREKKLDVLQWIQARRSEHNKARFEWEKSSLAGLDEPHPGRHQAVNDASEYFSVPSSTIKTWVYSADRILRSRKRSRRNVDAVKKQARPVLEAQLCSEFLKQRSTLKPIGQ